MKNQHFNRWIVYQCAICHNYVTMSIYWRVSDLASQPILGLWYFGPQDRYGKLVSSSPIAREVGTTVSAGGSANCPWSWWLQAATIAARQQRFEVRELFKRLPVRHKEFMKNAKSQATCRRTFFHNGLESNRTPPGTLSSGLGPRQRIIQRY